MRGIVGGNLGAKGWAAGAGAERASLLSCEEAEACEGRGGTSRVDGCIDEEAALLSVFAEASVLDGFFPKGRIVGMRSAETRESTEGEAASANCASSFFSGYK